ncbi:MAG: Holliday junction branch migration protein RuvA [Candidatus Peribacteraceae bacterium]|nr:Holliday junction branch migration protein RuvA [Candidatus Peribacteraceae bacterium]
MLYTLTGTVTKLDLPQIAVDVGGVGYLVSVPYPLWESLEEGVSTTVTVYTHVREDRLDLFGFLDKDERALFAGLLSLTGVGPKIALELCSIQRHLLMTAVEEGDIGTLTSIKGIGKKTAEKLLVDLKSLVEKHPEWHRESGSKHGKNPAPMDADAIAALMSLGYDQTTAKEALRNIPADAKTSADRVTAALRSL